MTSAPMPFVDLAAQRGRIGAAIDAAMARVVSHGAFIMGPEVHELEDALARRAQADHAVSCASGTDAIVLALLAHGIGSGDAVVTPTFTFAATAEAVALLGAVPVFVDSSSETFNIDASQLDEAVTVARRQGLRPRAVLAVDMFGLPAEYEPLTAFCASEELLLIADAAQSFGASVHGRPVGSLAPITTTSFFPAKPLGCYGDGGAIFTDDDGVAATLRSLRVHGQGSHKYENVRVGINGRLDTIQAAVLIEKLRIFDDELALRGVVAERYAALLDGMALPRVPAGVTSAWAQYTVRLRGRDRVAAAARAVGVPTAVYYPVPLHRQPAYRAFPRVSCLARADQLADEVLSLPFHPYLDEESQRRVVAAITAGGAP